MNKVWNYTVYIMIILEKEAKSLVEISQELKVYSLELKNILDEMIMNNLIVKNQKYNLTFEGEKIIKQIKVFY